MMARSVCGTPAPPVASVAVIRGILSPGVIIRIRIHIVYSEGHSLVLGWVARRADVTDAPPRSPPSIRGVNLLYMCARVFSRHDRSFTPHSNGIMVPYMGAWVSGVAGPQKAMEWKNSGKHLFSFRCGEGGNVAHSAPHNVPQSERNEGCASTDTKEHTTGYSSHYHDAQSHSTPTHKQQSTVRRAG